MIKRLVVRIRSWLGILLYFGAIQHTTVGFLIHPRSFKIPIQPHHQAGYGFFLAAAAGEERLDNEESDDDDADDDTEENVRLDLELNGDTTRKQLRRQQRNADFPSFACVGMNKKTKIRNKPTKVQEQQTGLMKYRTRQGEEVVFRPYGKKQTTGPWWYSEGVYDFLDGTPFEASLTEITQAAERTRLRTDRSYAQKEAFEYENISCPPNLVDLTTPPVRPLESFWISPAARLLSFAGAYFFFPFLTRFIDAFVNSPVEQIDEITSKFTPGISILYGTFISLTLSILYNRLKTIQDNVGIECAYLVVVTRNLLSLFRDNGSRAVEAGQCVADQIRTLVRSSRGAELMLLMYSDPYARMRELLDAHEEELYESKRKYDGRSSSLIGNARDTIKDLFRVRASRLSDEALALPPTHFLILNFLTLLILLGYTVSVVPTLNNEGYPSNESCLLFAVLTTIYVLFYNFASDLNSPFTGVYQVRRSCAASHLLQLKWLISNHPLLCGKIDFEEGKESSDVVQIRSPGLGDIWFEREELFEVGDVEDDPDTNE